MPYAIRKSGSGDKPYCLIKKDDGKKMGCHETREGASEQMRAIYASEHAMALVESFNDDEELDPTLDPAVTLAAEDDDDDDDTVEHEWSGYIAFEGVSTGDNRQFAEGAITWDELPLPLLWQKSSTDGHGGSVVVGRVDEIERHEGGKIFANGVLLDTSEANEYRSLLDQDAAGGVSVDGDSAQYSVEEVEGQKPKVLFNSMRIRGITAVAIPAFAGANIKLNTDIDAETEFCAEAECTGCHHGEKLTDFEMKEKKDRRKKARKKAKMWTYATEADAVAAAAAPVRPPLDWFQDQRLPGPTPQTILETGQVFGHLALWGTCHIGMPKCTTPPKGGSYAYFHTGALETVEGAEISVGHLTFNTGHAALSSNAALAASHYDHTGTVAADVVVGEDEYGIWFAGALRPHLEDNDVRAFRAAPLSGDWRRIGSRMELVGALSVNTPGFPVPRTRTKVLVASGHDEAFISTTLNEDYETIGRQTYKEDLAAKVNKLQK